MQMFLLNKSIFQCGSIRQDNNSYQYFMKIQRKNMFLSEAKQVMVEEYI